MRKGNIDQRERERLSREGKRIVKKKGKATAHIKGRRTENLEQKEKGEKKLRAESGEE
jgi:hypothetical protein